MTWRVVASRQLRWAVMRPQTEVAASKILAAASGTKSSACSQSACPSLRSSALKKLRFQRLNRTCTSNWARTTAIRKMASPEPRLLRPPRWRGGPPETGGKRMMFANQDEPDGKAACSALSPLKGRAILGKHLIRHKGAPWAQIATLRNYHHDAVGQTGQFLRHAAEQKAGKAAAPASTDNENVGFFAADRIEDRFGRLAPAG